MPFSCAASIAHAICLAMSTASRTRTGPRAMALGQRLALHELQHQEEGAGVLLQAINGGDVRGGSARPGGELRA